MENQLRRIFIIIIVGILILLFSSFILNKLDQNLTIPVEIEGLPITLNLEIAVTAEERSRGLMDRSHLNEDSGMLFVFPQSEILTFWMKDTLIPLDIIFLDERKEIINIHHQTTPNQTTETYRSSSPAKYAVELNGGWATSQNLEIGDIFIFILDNNRVE